MTDSIPAPAPTPALSADQYASEIARLNKIIQVLMDRAEFGINAESSDFSLFQTTISLEEKVRKRTHELQKALAQLAQANEELDTSLTALKTTQAQLVESKKMAALGGLVAGVAHEINTPVGISITASSLLVSDAQEVRQQLQKGTLTQSRIERFLDLIEECGTLSLNSLNRVAHLVSDFKQVAVDQQSMSRHPCHINQVISDACTLLDTKLKAHQVELQLVFEQEIMGDTYESAIGQIITNLINNALEHAFTEPPQSTNRIQIQVQHQDAMLTLLFSDNGKGISPEVLNRVFEPFYTTRRGEGGMGLGLHILYNLVTEILNGTVRCHSELGQGCHFEISFPL